MTAHRLKVNHSPTMHVKIGNLRRLGQEAISHGGLEADFALSRDAHLPELWKAIADAGFECPASLTAGSKTWHPHSQKTVLEPYDEIPIVETRSEDANAIELNESLLVYADRRYGEKGELNVDTTTSSHGSPCECLQDSRGLTVTFLRTTRMPDDGKLHQLPAALGTFPLHNVSDYAAALPNKMVDEGGVFMPMWQREAMWMSFKSSSNMRYALRISVGRINAVSGRSMDEPADDSTEAPQDYVVVPGQQWLDGICVGPGVVRQFVAMPLGSGYTVEGQKTGEEKHGGLQLEIIPSLQTNLRSWTGSDSPINPLLLDHPWNNPLKEHLLLEDRTPQQLGYTTGTSLRSYPVPAHKTVPCALVDLLTLDEHEVQLSAFYLPTLPMEHEHSGSGLSVRFVPQLKPMGSASNYLFSDQNMKSASSSHAPLLYLGSYGNVAQSWSEELDQADFTALPDAVPEAAAGNTDDEIDATESETIDTSQLKAMGLAAGGKLMQDIYEDRNDAKIWNSAASRLVNIHILDPLSCEAVTHIVPPPPPMDPDTYAKAGLPLFVVEEKPDERLEGGDFGTVKSVSAMDKQGGFQEQQSLDPTKPTQCQCGVRLCDCVVRPCGHQFCNVCVKEMDPHGSINWSSAEPSSKTARWSCPTCKASVAYVAGFSAPMNLPGEETVKTRVPVNVLEVLDGRLRFKSMQKSRM